MESMKPELPKAVTHGVETADIAFIGVGMCYGVILEAMDILSSKGIHTQYHQVRTLWPMLDETPAFTQRCPNNFVVEYNYQAQLKKLIHSHGGNEENMHSILRYDGVPMQAKDLVNEVITKLNLKEDKVA